MLQNYTFKFIIAMAAITPLILAAQIAVKKVLAKKQNIKKDAVRAIFITYMMFLIYVTIINMSNIFMKIDMPLLEMAKYRLENNIGINFKPFRTIRSYSVHTFHSLFAINVVGNVVMFMPFGFLLPIIKKKSNFIKIFLTGALLSLSIETIQLLVGRSVDVDDLMLNVLGVALGYGTYKTAKLLCGKKL